jgi:hypothetical protein
VAFSDRSGRPNPDRAEVSKRGYTGSVRLPAKTDDPEVADLRRRLVSLPMESQARVLEGVLTPGLRLRVLAEQVRHQVGALTEDQEVLSEREIDDTVRDVRRSLTCGR